MGTIEVYFACGFVLILLYFMSLGFMTDGKPFKVALEVYILIGLNGE